MRRIKLVLGALAIVLATFVAFSVPAMAQNDLNCLDAWGNLISCGGQLYSPVDNSWDNGCNALPAYAASPSDPGPVGYRWIPEEGRVLYCDNFYYGPPMATTPSGAPWQEIQEQWVHWCYVDTKGYWVPTNPSYYG